MRAERGPYGCLCGGCESCLRAQGGWGAHCVYCDQWVDWDDEHASTVDGYAHVACLDREQRSRLRETPAFQQAFRQLAEIQFQRAGLLTIDTIAQALSVESTRVHAWLIDRRDAPQALVHAVDVWSQAQ